VWESGCSRHVGTLSLTSEVSNPLVSTYLEMREELVRFLTARLGDRATAEDVNQELFVRLRLGQFSGDIASPRAYVFKAAYNAANEYERARRRQTVRDTAWVDSTTQKIGADTVSNDVDAERALEAKHRLRVLTNALAELPPKCREVFTLCRLRELSHREVADTLGITTKTVEKHMTTALKYLTTKFGQNH
jgi:RNA polymerase sigma factor (sigma-70 family)